MCRGPSKICNGNLYLSLLSDYLIYCNTNDWDMFTTTAPTKTHNTTKQKCLGRSNLKYQITRTRKKQVWKYCLALYPNLFHLWLYVLNQANVVFEHHLITYSYQLLYFFKVIFTWVAWHNSIYLLCFPKKQVRPYHLWNNTPFIRGCSWFSTYG